MNSGFSVVAKNIARELKKLGHQVTFTGMQTAYLSEYGDDIEILPIQVGHIDDMTQYIITLDRIKPDVVLNIFQADYDFNDFPKVFKKCLWYVPVEGKSISYKMVSALLDVKMNGGRIVAQTDYGKNEIQLTLAGLDIDRIYHGYDNNIFRPIDISKKEEITYCYYNTEFGRSSSNPIMLHENGCYNCQYIMYPKCPNYKEEIVTVMKFIDGKWGELSVSISQLSLITKDKIVYLSVGQNLGVRKRMERLLKAFSIFIGGSKQCKDRCILHIHTMPMSIVGINLIKIIQDLGIQNNVIFSYGNNRSSGWSDVALNILYNTADVNVSASSGEGTCLPMIEGFATGLPMIASNCSSFTEFIGNDKDESKNRGWLVNIESWQMIVDGSERALVSESDLAMKMKMSFVEKDKMKIFSKNAIEFMKNYTWEKIVVEWDKLLKKMK
jgi:glycosyltransferase involved in cell wall biosynthesis